MSFKRKVSKTDPSPSKRQKIATNSETKTIYVTDISDYIEVIDGMEQVDSAVEVDIESDIIGETIGDNIGDNFDGETGDKGGKYLVFGSSRSIKVRVFSFLSLFVCLFVCSQFSLP